MKNKIIKIIKKNPILYKIAKKIYRKFVKENVPKKICEENFYFLYILENLEELEKIKKHFKELNYKNAYLTILINNENYNIIIHDLIEQEDAIILSANYFRKYNKKINFKKMILLDYKNQNYKNIINLI